MAYKATMTRRNHTRGPAIVLGTLVLVAFTVFLLAAAPGKTMLQASGVSGEINPMSGLGNMYGLDNMRCAFEAMSCNLSP